MKPSGYNIEALAASTVIVWTKETWDELMAAIPALKLFTEPRFEHTPAVSIKPLFPDKLC
jgi:hypothetical protein